MTTEKFTNPKKCPDVKYLDPRKCPDSQSKSYIFTGDAVSLAWTFSQVISSFVVILGAPERLSGIIHLFIYKGSAGP